MKTLTRSAALLLCLLLLFSASVPVWAEDTAPQQTPEEIAFAERRATLIQALDTALTNKAAALRTEAESALDPQPLTEQADCLSSFVSTQENGYDPAELAHVEELYEALSICIFRSFADAADDLADLLVTSCNLPVIIEDHTVTTALIYCYANLLGDKYMSYYDKETLAEHLEDTEAHYVGIGVVVTTLESGYMQIVHVTEGSPAEEAGFQVEDIIKKVAGEDVSVLGKDQAISRIKGEEGVWVTLTVERNGEELDITSQRRAVTEITVMSDLLDSPSGKKVGYVRITEFDEGTYEQFVHAIEALETAGASRYVFDLRNNPGGQVRTVLAILDYILPKGQGIPLVRLNYKKTVTAPMTVEEYVGSAYAKVYYSKALRHEIVSPIAVLCNEYTASAGELFTSCLQDFGVAKVFGVRTFGKGTGQTSLYVSDERNTLINISTFTYSPPVSDNYEGKGVTPNVVVNVSEQTQNTNLYLLKREDDETYLAAVDYLETQESREPTETEESIPPEENPPEEKEPEDEDPALPERRSFLNDPLFFWGFFAAVGVALTVLAILLLCDRRKKKAASLRDENDFPGNSEETDANPPSENNNSNND
ncbi:MAG: S41 family peptidase [Clostridia bacterium]|nr:S41 family peptidase [Clostridia bacterium]